MQTEAQRSRHQAGPDAAESAGNQNGRDEKKVEGLVAERRGEQRLHEKKDYHEGC
jgi:hypothetical protein